MKKRDLYYERIPTKLLREDIRHLGTILGEVIKDQEGTKFFNLVEKVRKLSKANKINLKNKNSFKKLVKTVKSANPKDTFRLTRAFSHLINFINLAEAIDTARNLDEYGNEISQGQETIVKDVSQENGKKPDITKIVPIRKVKLKDFLNNKDLDKK